MRALLLSPLALTIACSCPSDKPEVVPSVAPLPEVGPPPARVERIPGVAFSQEQGLYLTICGAEHPSKLVGSGLDELREALASLEQGPGDPPVPVEVLGAVRDQPGGGTMIAVSALNVALPPGGAGLCELDSSYLYKAAGSEPFWSLVVLEGRLRFEAMDLEAPIELAATAARVPGVSGPGWTGESDGHSLRVQLLPERCYDGMSGAAYPFRAEVTLDGERLQGCAHQGWGSPR
jgi:uncharacterized membrane protein